MCGALQLFLMTSTSTWRFGGASTMWNLCEGNRGSTLDCSHCSRRSFSASRLIPLRPTMASGIPVFFPAASFSSVAEHDRSPARVGERSHVSEELLLRIVAAPGKLALVVEVSTFPGLVRHSRREGSSTRPAMSSAVMGRSSGGASVFRSAYRRHRPLGGRPGACRGARHRSCLL